MVGLMDWRLPETSLPHQRVGGLIVGHVSLNGLALLESELRVCLVSLWVLFHPSRLCPSGALWASFQLSNLIRSLLSCGGAAHLAGAPDPSWKVRHLQVSRLAKSLALRPGWVWLRCGLSRVTAACERARAVRPAEAESAAGSLPHFPRGLPGPWARAAAACRSVPAPSWPESGAG